MSCSYLQTGKLSQLPYVFVGDEAFPLSYHLMRPYPGKYLAQPRYIYNKRLSRARRVVEMAFGILAQRFRVLLRPIPLKVENVDTMVKAICCLHNFLIKHSPNYSDFSMDDINPSDDSMVHYTGNASTVAKNVRNAYTSYFTSHPVVHRH